MYKSICMVHFLTAHIILEMESTQYDWHKFGSSQMRSRKIQPNMVRALRRPKLNDLGLPCLCFEWAQAMSMPKCGLCFARLAMLPSTILSLGGNKFGFNWFYNTPISSHFLCNNSNPLQTPSNFLNDFCLLINLYANVLIKNYGW